MREETFRRLCEIVYEQSGITLGAGKESLVQARIGKRLRTLGLSSHEEYLAYLDSDEPNDELGELIDAIATNVTSFYREADHFELLEELLTDWARKGQRRFRVWSAAAATGEEPYTIALTMAEALGIETDFRILGTDISRKALRACVAGEYEAEKLASVPRGALQQFFSPVTDGGGKRFRVQDRLKRKILFKKLDLSRPPYPMKGPLDVVFCRNVMIYFDTALRRRLVQEAAKLLKPGGYLLVGHAESVSGLAPELQAVRASVYKKPG